MNSILELSVLQDIESKLKINVRDTLQYIRLGDFYLDKNINKAYLSYEHALLYANDIQSVEIREKIDNIKYKTKVVPASVVILSYNSKQLIEQTINTIRNNCYCTEYEIVVVDNNSDSETVEYLRNERDITLKLNSENEGFPKGCNTGIDLACEENDIWLLNNDVIVTPNSLFWLRMNLYDSSNIGACGSVSNYVANGQMVEIDYQSEEEYSRLIEINNSNIINSYMEKSWLVGFSLLIKREVLDKVGILDERFSPGNYEDNDIGIRIKKAGYENRLCLNSYIIHLGSKSFGKNKDDYIKLMETNRAKFIEKWGFEPKDSDKVSGICVDTEKVKAFIEKQEWDFWKYYYKENVEEKIKKIQEMLKNIDNIDENEVCNILKQDNFFKKYMRDKRVAFLLLAITIYMEERNAKVDNHIFKLADNIEELQNIVDDIKKAVWRVEQFNSEEADRDFLDIVSRYNVSDEMIYAIVTRMSLKGAETYYIMGYYMKQMNKYITTLKFYFKALEELPEDENILCEIADVYWSVGLYDKSMEFIKKIKNPTECLSEYLNKWENADGQ